MSTISSHSQQRVSESEEKRYLRGSTEWSQKVSQENVLTDVERSRLVFPKGSLNITTLESSQNIFQNVLKSIVQ